MAALLLVGLVTEDHHASPSVNLPLFDCSTDALILLKVLRHHGISLEDGVAKLPLLKQAMIDHFLAHSKQAGEGLELLPGVLPLLNALAARPDVAVCLVTGNLEPIGASPHCAQSKIDMQATCGLL